MPYELEARAGISDLIGPFSPRVTTPPVVASLSICMSRNRANPRLRQAKRQLGFLEHPGRDVECILAKLLSPGRV